MIDKAKEAIGSIKEVEAKADDIIKKAQDEAHKMVLNARMDSNEMIYWAEADATAEARSILEKTKAVIEQEMDKIIKNTEKERAAIEAKAKSGLPGGVEFITREMLKFYGDSKA